MLEELQRRNFAQTTLQYYLKAVEDFALHFGKPPDQLNGDHLRQYQVYLLNERKLQPRTARLHVSALRFFFIKTLKRRLPLDDMPYPKAPRRLPIILTVEEVARLIDSAHNLLDRTMLMALYSTGMRNREMRYLQVKDIDSKSMLIHIQMSDQSSRPLVSGPRKGTAERLLFSRGLHLAAPTIDAGALQSQSRLSDTSGSADCDKSCRR